MKRSTTVILGVPVDALTMDEALERVFHLVETYRIDHVPRLVCTVNTDFLANTMSWSLNMVRHPELLSILRGADLVTADGMPLVWASRYLGPGLKERVTGADLVPLLAREAALGGRSLYFLGGAPGTAEQAAQILKDRNPGLTVAGCDSPVVHVAGPELAAAPEKDGEIVERINRSAPDILFVAFGSPKQELFFERNRHRLRVPVTIGVGGTFEFITGSVRRAPGWMQSSGLEWLFRFTQDPGRLGKRYLNDLVKLGTQIWPSIFRYQYARQVAPHAFLKKLKSKVSYKYMTRGSEQVLLLTLPGTVDAEAVPRLALLMPARPTAHLVLDVSDVAYIDSAGLGLLLGAMGIWTRCGREVVISGATPYARQVLTANRLMDLFGGRIFDTLEEALACLGAHAGTPAWRMEVRDEGSSSTIAFFGSLKPPAVSPAELRVTASRVNGSRCTLDLSGLDSISTQGIILLLRLKQALEKQGKSCSSRGARGETARMLKLTATGKLL
jgi:N-acetylglucosaminyldiphosphoundecaprenol N-acetyl-beta-D-mannosaminyltransferase